MSDFRDTQKKAADLGITLDSCGLADRLYYDGHYDDLCGMDYNDTILPLTGLTTSGSTEKIYFNGASDDLSGMSYQTALEAMNFYRCVHTVPPHYYSGGTGGDTGSTKPTGSTLDIGDMYCFSILNKDTDTINSSTLAAASAITSASTNTTVNFTLPNVEIDDNALLEEFYERYGPESGETEYKKYIQDTYSNALCFAIDSDILNKNIVIYNNTTVVDYVIVKSGITYKKNTYNVYAYRGVQGQNTNINNSIPNGIDMVVTVKY